MIYGRLTRYKNALFLQLLQEVTEQLEARGIEYWLDWGTLLGAWRSGSLLTHDTDVDLAIPRSQAAALRERPLVGDWVWDDHPETVFVRRPADPLRETLSELVCLQIYFVEERDSQWWHEPDGSPVPQQFVLPLGRLRLGARHYPVPAHPGDYLEALYGYIGPRAIYLGHNRYRPCRSLVDYAFYYWNSLIFYRIYFYWKALPLRRSLKHRLQSGASEVYCRFLATPKT